MNKWWKDVLGALAIAAILVIILYLFGCAARPYVEVGADQEIRKSEAYGCWTLGYAGVGVQKEWKDGAVEGDLALRHYSCLFMDNDEATSNVVGVHERIYPQEFRKKK